MNIKTRLISSVVLIFLVAAGMFAATWVVTSSQKDDSLVINLAGRQRMLSQKLAKETFGFTASKNEAVKKQITSTIAVFEKTLSALTNSGQAPLTLDPNGASAHLPNPSPAVYAQLGQVKQLWALYKDHVGKAISSGKTDVALISKDSVDVLKAMNKAVVMMQGESEQRVTTLIYAQLGCLVIGLIIILFVLMNLQSKLTTPLSNLGKFAKQVADGNLDAEVEGDFVHELKDLKEATETMVSNIKENMDEVESKSQQAEKSAIEAKVAMNDAKDQQEQVRKLLDSMSLAAGKASDISDRVAASVSQLASKVDEVNNGTDVQRDRMAETATAMEEMNATVLEVARNASSAAESAGLARENAQTGADGVRAAVDSIDAIREQILDLNASMSELGEQAENIGNIMNVVTDIADQTNLLALNAAIEAARAGEAGRGFAVVADEVRKLAEKTMDATKEVGNAVHTIQTQARDNIKAVEKSVQDIIQSTEAASESGQFMDEIVSIVGETAGMVESIATASEEQSAASEEINMAVADVTQVASETAQGMAEASQALDAMAAMANDLDIVIREMSGENSAMLNPDIKTLEEIEAELHAEGRRMSDRSGLKVSDPTGMMQWADDLSTNIRWVDEQHIRLIDLINELQKAMSQGKGKDVVADIIKELSEYTVFHFGNEEREFDRLGYPETDSHKNAHRMFVEKIQDFEDQVRSGSSAVTMEIMNFLKDWLVKHIMVVDRQYSHFFNKNDIY